MKRNLPQNEEGFYLIYTVFVCLIVFTALSTSIIVYRHEVSETDKLIALTKRDTLVQMATSSFKQSEWYNGTENGEVMYNFPDGTVVMTYTKTDQHSWQLLIDITTTDQYTFSSIYILPIS